MKSSFGKSVLFAEPVHPNSAVRDEDNDEIDLLALVRTLWRGKWWIALCAMLAVVVGANYAYRVAVPTYTATAEMVLQIDQTSVVDIESILTGFDGDWYAKNTEMAVIRSGELIGQLVDRLDLVSDPEFNWTLQPAEEGFSFRDIIKLVRDIAFPTEAEAPTTPPTEAEIRNEVVTAVRSVFQMENDEDTYTFLITATTEDPLKSVLLANSLAEVYRDDQVAQKVAATENAAVWLSGRVSELQSELVERQSAITELRTQSALVSAESLAALNDRSVALQQELQAVRLELDEATERSIAMEAVVLGSNDAKVDAAHDVQLTGIQAAVVRGDPAAQLRFDRRYESIRRLAAAEVLRLADLSQELEVEAERLKQQFEQQSSAFAELQELERETEATRVLYETFLTRLKETTVQEGVHQPDSRILTRATSGELVAPRKSRILAFSLVVGIIAGSALVLARELTQNTYRTAEELEQTTGISVLGQVPKIPSRGRHDTISYLSLKPTSAPAEAVRNLRTSVLLSDLDKPPQVIMSTSSVPQEGKTTIAIALAQNFAGLEKRVILIEGDIRRRTFGAYFPEASEKGGLLSVISGKLPLAEAVWRERGIDVLMGQRSTINAADVFSSDSFRSLIAELRATYDYIIIDTPPVLVVPDSRVIGQHVDAIIYSVRWDQTRRHQVKEGLRQFQTANLRVAGLVLSQIDPKGMKRYGYGDKYGAYSSYASGYYDT